MAKKKKRTGKRKQAEPKERNWLAVHAHNRKGGAMPNKKKKQNKKACRVKPKEER